MKPNRSFHVATFALLAFIVALISQNAHAEAPRSASGPSEWIVPVFVPDIAAFPQLDNGNWIDLADLPASDRPESSFQGFLLPHINAIYTGHKSVIESLTADCSVILIDYKESERGELSALPIDRIVAVGICGPQARVVTTSALTPGSNPALVPSDLLEFVTLAKEASSLDK